MPNGSLFLMTWSYSLFVLILFTLLCPVSATFVPVSDLIYSSCISNVLSFYMKDIGRRFGVVYMKDILVEKVVYMKDRYW